ncbi:MAG: M3 family metallopeptidase, partial [Moheibacter sp.]
MTNPLLDKFNTPFDSIPFSKIKDEDYEPAFKTALEEARREVDEICKKPEKPTFKNTVEALEISGEKLGIVSSAFFNLLHAETNENMQETAQIVSPLLSEFSNDIRLNPVLFERIKSVYENKESFNLNPEQIRLLEKSYRNFSRNGANLPDDKKEKLREIDKQLAKLKLDFGQNVLAETNDFELHLTDENDLEGLPDFVVEQAKHEAETKEKEGWIFTLHAPSYIPFMTYSSNRELRKKMNLAYGKRAFQNNEHNNEEIVKSIARLRLERAQLLGYQSHADFVLEERMANSPKIVKGFLNDLLSKSKKFGERDVNEIREFAKQTDGIEDLQKWDHAYYAEKLKKQKFDFSAEELK